jgi:3-hydroxyacyl-CoA dehydrogenase
MKLSQIKNIVVVGSGIMGHGIGQTFALGGYEVTLNDISDALLNKALQQIKCLCFGNSESQECL